MRAPGGTCAEVLGRRSWTLSLQPWKSFKIKSRCLLLTPLWTAQWAAGLPWPYRAQRRVVSAAALSASGF